MVHILKYIRNNKTLGLKYYDDMKDAPSSELLRQASIKAENKLMAFYNSSCQYCPDTVRSTEVHIIFYKDEIIDHGTHVTGTVAQ